MAKRGFFAEMQHQNQVAARRREQAQKALNRQQAAAAREAEAAQRKAEQAHNQAVRASAAEQKRAEAEAKRLHIEAMMAEVDSLNSQLAENYEQIDTLLASTLAVDDYVDLEQLRSVAVHPPFDRHDLEQPLQPPAPIQPPPEPQWVEPPAPKGLSGALGGKKRHEDARARLWAEYSAQHDAWKVEASKVPAMQFEQMQTYQLAEQQRQAALADARLAYDAACAKREQEAAASNAELDALLRGLESGAAPAVAEYVSIVLSNSAYPESLPVDYDFEFDAGLKELTLRVSIPSPDDVPRLKAYKYTKATDEITSSDLTQKAQKDRYASIVCQVALRSIHEVFEADRRGCIQTISLSVGTEAIDPGTGHPTSTPLAAVATDRSTFEAIDLSAVVPRASLDHLGALVSKNPHGLVAIDTSAGVRGK